MIDRYLVRYFLAVVDQGNFSRAADQCHVAQPTLSVGIAKLEKLLDCQLFERNPRRVALTAAGSRFARHARRIESEFLDAERETGAGAPNRALRLGVVTTFPAALLGAALAAVAAGEALEIVEGRPRELDVLLDRGRVDAVLSVVGRRQLPTRTVVREGYAMALAADHWLAGRATVEAEELAGETMLVRRHCEALPAISRFFTSRGVRPAMVAKTYSDARALDYVRAGLGITMIPECLATAGVALVRVNGFDETRTIGVQTLAEAAGLLADDQLPGRIARELAAACEFHRAG